MKSEKIRYICANLFLFIYSEYTKQKLHGKGRCKKKGAITKIGEKNKDYPSNFKRKI